MLSKIYGQMQNRTTYYTAWCFLAGLYSYGTNEVAVMGRDAVAKNLELQKIYLPQCIFMGSSNEENLPLLENKLPVNQTLIYVCTNRICKLPVEDARLALKQLN